MGMPQVDQQGTCPAAVLAGQAPFMPIHKLGMLLHVENFYSKSTQYLPASHKLLC